MAPVYSDGKLEVAWHKEDVGYVALRAVNKGNWAVHPNDGYHACDDAFEVEFLGSGGVVEDPPNRSTGSTEKVRIRRTDKSHKWDMKLKIPCYKPSSFLDHRALRDEIATDTELLHHAVSASSDWGKSWASQNAGNVALGYNELVARYCGSSRTGSKEGDGDMFAVLLPAAVFAPSMIFYKGKDEVGKHCAAGQNTDDPVVLDITTGRKSFSFMTAFEPHGVWEPFPAGTKVDNVPEVGSRQMLVSRVVPGCFAKLSKACCSWGIYGLAVGCGGLGLLGGAVFGAMKVLGKKAVGGEEANDGNDDDEEGGGEGADDGDSSESSLPQKLKAYVMGHPWMVAAVCVTLVVVLLVWWCFADEEKGAEENGGASAASVDEESGGEVEQDSDARESPGGKSATAESADADAAEDSSADSSDGDDTGSISDESDYSCALS